MKILITAGGGGHFNPALCVIKSLPKDSEVLFVGRKYTFEGEKTLSLEYHTVSELRIPFKAISTGRLQRKFTRHTISSLLKIPMGLIHAYQILSDFKPDVVFSTGGYISLPVTTMAFFLKIPIVIHEQTLEGGMSNKIASFFSKKICISWESSRKHFPGKKVVLTGNPIRSEMIETYHKKAPSEKKRPLIYITGGSQGSHIINVLVEGCVERLLGKFTVIHQTGAYQESADFKRLLLKKEQFEDELRNRYILKEFVSTSDVGHILKEADLVISRSGMNTITELLYFGKVAILIPLAFSQSNEQLKNALFYKKTGLAEIMEQSHLTSETLYEKINDVMEKHSEYEKNAGSGKHLVSEDSTQKIIDVILSASAHETKR